MISVLVVEDFQLVRGGIISNISREKDMEVVAEVETTEDAILKTFELKPDIVLMDLKLGDDDFGGIKATREIKNEDNKIKVLILTFYDDIEHITQAIEARVDGYLLKDVNRTDLIKAIRTIHSGQSVIHPTIATKMMHQMTEKGEMDSQKRKILDALSSREIEVYGQLAKGLSNKDIASNLYISEATVKAHVSSILRKLKVTTRTQAVITALRLRIFDK